MDNRYTRANVENDVQLDGMRVWEETGENCIQHWVRGGFNLSISGGINLRIQRFLQVLENLC